MYGYSAYTNCGTKRHHVRAARKDGPHLDGWRPHHTRNNSFRGRLKPGARPQRRMKTCAKHVWNRLHLSFLFFKDVLPVAAVTVLYFLKRARPYHKRPGPCFRARRKGMPPFPDAEKGAVDARQRPYSFAETKTAGGLWPPNPLPGGGGPLFLFDPQFP